MNRDAFSRIMGVTVEEWIAADTPEKLAALLHHRDNPPICTVKHTDTINVYAFGGTLIRTTRAEPCNGYHP